MSLRKPIPAKIREKLAAEQFMKHCCIQDKTCEGRIEWNHHLKWGGKRMNEPWGILPMCSSHHRREAQFRGELDKIMVRRATNNQLLPYCKVTDYIALKLRTFDSSE